MWNRTRLWLALGAACLLAGALLRAWLWWRFGVVAGVGAPSLPLLLGAGLLNDAVVAIYLLGPLAAYLALLPDRWHRSAFNRRLLACGGWLTLFALAFLAVTESYFFEEFDARFNLVAFDYLAYPTEVAGDIWQEYPVLRAILFAAACATAGLWWVRGRALDRAGPVIPLRVRLQALAVHASVFLLALAFWSTDLLSHSTNRVANELVQNGLSSFLRAARTSEIDYHANYLSADRNENLMLVAQELARGGGRFTNLQAGRLDRAFPTRANGLGRLNIVLVSIESFGAEFSRMYGSERDLTPQFDALARQGVWFSNAYASGTRTVRGLEAFVSSMPPIPTVSILRRPGNENVATWGAVMRSLGYQTSFLYGGYGYFDNMNYFFGNNGFATEDRNDIQSVRFENIWGVSDEDLFDHSLAHLDALQATGKPFFTVIMTTSNHKPFTFRSGLEGLGIPPADGGRAAGVRYADYALGRFLENARSHDWFDDTLFVVAADHGARVYGAEQIPLKTYEIPLIFYSPMHLSPQRVDSLMTQIDIAPTVLGLLGLPYEAPFFGQDALRTPPKHRVALFNHNHDVAIYRDGHIVVYGLKRSVANYQYDRASDHYEPADRDPALERLGIAYFQTAYELFEERRYLPSDVQSSAQRPTQSP